VERKLRELPRPEWIEVLADQEQEPVAAIQVAAIEAESASTDGGQRLERMPQ